MAHAKVAVKRTRLALLPLLLAASFLASALLAGGAVRAFLGTGVADSIHIQHLRAATAPSAAAVASASSYGSPARNSRVPRRALVLTPVDTYDEDDDDYYEDKEEKTVIEVEEEEEPLPPPPVLYRGLSSYTRLRRQVPGPGHLAQRRWLKKGKLQGYVTVPFTTAVRSMLQEPDVNMCLVGRRENSDKVSRAWQEVIDELPTFEIKGEAVAPRDLDPLEPEIDYPLNEPLPTDEEIRAELLQDGMLEQMIFKYNRPEAELRPFFTESNCNILRQVVAGLPAEFLGPEYADTVRGTVLEIVKVLWTMHLASDAAKMRWRLACTDADGLDEEDDEEKIGLRGYLIFAGEALEFIPQQFIDRRLLDAESSLSADSIQRQASEDWAASVSKQGTNISESLKRVPAGWTTFLKGDAWPGNGENGAVHRLPQNGKRLFLQVDFLEAEAPESTESKEKEAPSGSESEEAPSAMRWLGPMAGVAASLFELARRTPPFRAGVERRKEMDSLIRALQQRPEPVNQATTDRLDRFEQNLWMDFEVEDAPCVLLVGGESYTGRAISRKLVMRGYHVTVLQKPKPRAKRVAQTLPQGTVVASTPADVESTWVNALDNPDDIYDAVTGIDKIIVCDADSASDLTWQGVKNVLSAWQIYRQDYAEMQRSFTAKVQLFNFDLDEHFELWDVDRQRPSDMSFGGMKVGWTRVDKARGTTAMFAGQFAEEVGQICLKSPVLKLNLQRFSGVVFRSYNQAYDNKYFFFIRTSDFEETRIQYECPFEDKASTWQMHRLPFSAFTPRRCDGSELPQEIIDEMPLRRDDIIQLGILVRTPEENVFYENGMYNPFRLHLEYLKVFRTQAEPQVVYLGSTKHLNEIKGQQQSADEDVDEEDILGKEIFIDSDFEETWEKMQEAEREAEQEVQAVTDGRTIQPLAGDPDMGMEQVEKGHRIPVNAVLASGLACTIVWVNKLNEHPGGKFPIAVRQADINEKPLSASGEGLGGISRGDAAELVVSALLEPSCMNAEFAAGEKLAEGSVLAKAEGEDEFAVLPPTFEISSTLQENVADYLKQLTPNK